MPTVCIDSRYIGPRPSGIAEVVQALVDHAPGLAPDLDFLLLKHPQAPARLSLAPNVREVVVSQPANGPATMWWLPRVVDLSGVDLFHATFNIMPAGLAMPCITTIHDVMWLTHPEWCNPRFYGRIERLFYRNGIRRALRDAAAIATVSSASREEILACRPDAAERTFVTLSGVSDVFHPVPAAPDRLRQLGLAPGRSYVLTVGQYAPYKNHEVAVQAFARAFGNRRDIDLIFVQRLSKGAERLARVADELGIGERVRFLRSIGREDLLQLYSGASALLHPSICEGFGNPLAEAMACGCPVVTSELSAMPEVTGGAALLADPRDAATVAACLLDVVDHPATAARMRAAGLARAAQLNWRAFAEANVSIYRKVLAA